MAVDGARFLVQWRKLAIRSIRTSSRSVRNHPFLVGAFLFVIFLYRSSPFLFSLLVSASPVLVCTAVLLGTLLSFGHPQIPEIDKDEKISCEISSLKIASGPNSTTVLQREVSGDKDVEDSAFMGDVCSVSRFEGTFLTPKNSREIVFEQQSVEEVNAECKSRKVEFKEGGDEGVLAFEGDHGYTDVHLETKNHDETPPLFEGTARASDEQEKGVENDGSREGSDDGHVDDHVESSSVPWTRMNGNRGDDNDNDDEDEGEDDDDDYEPSDSGSDGAESSSTDPSMADITSLLDELHPLIECENAISAALSCENPGLARNGSQVSHESSVNSEEETDHKSAEEEGGDNDDDEEENRGDKEDAERSAITWTEDDQKNLMDLGSSELERNLRLESLIARRRSRKNMRMMAERNLIDLDDFDLPFQVASISTTRQNPFDFPNDNYDNMGLPPIPGSAPSRLLRRNPFDLPYDSGEEKPDLMGDSFQQEFMLPNQKEPVFRRHESFHIGSSFFEFPRQEARDSNRASRFRPYFIPERLVSEGGSSFSSFVRQSSEISEGSSFHRQTSELSGSLSFHRQASGISESSSFRRQSSDMSESKASSIPEIEPVSAEVDQEEMKVSDLESTKERTPDPEIDHASEHVEHGSQSSGNFGDQIEKRDFDLHMPEIILGDSGTEFHQPERGHGDVINLGSSGNDRDVDSWVSEARELAAASAGIIEGDTHLTASPSEDKHYSSSSSLLSEEHIDVKEADEELVKGEEMGFHAIEKSDVQTENLSEASDFHQHHTKHTHAAERSPFETNLTLETIEEEHIINTSSSLASEERNIIEGLKHDEALMTIRPDDKNFVFPTEQVLNSSNFGFNMDVEESHPKDPVYDLSPQASNVNLSISSEVLVDLENKDLIRERDAVSHKNDRDADPRVDEEDSILSVVEERHCDAKSEHSSGSQADLFSTANKSTEEPNVGNEDARLADETSFYPANAVETPGNFKEKESIFIPGIFEEVSSENRLHCDVSAEMNDLLSFPLQTVGASSVAQELAQEPVIDFIDFSEPVKGRGEFEFESSIIGDADGKSPFTDSFVEGSDEIKEMEEALLSELDAVGDFHVAELGMALAQETLEPDNVGADINELSNSQISESNVWFQPLESEPIEKSSDENTEKSAPDVFFINEGEPEVQTADADMGEYPEFHVKQPGDELDEKSAPEEFINAFKLQMEDAETGLAEQLRSSQNIENFATDIEPINFHDELLVEGAEVDRMEGLESAIRTDEQITFHGNASEIEKEETLTEINRSASNIEEEIERSTVAATDVSLDSRADSLIEKDEQPAAEINESIPAIEEDTERSAIDDATSDSYIPKKDMQVKDDEQPAAETNELAPAMEEEPAVDVALDSHVNTVIDKAEQPAADINESVPAMEEEKERFAIDDTTSDFHVPKNDVQITNDEQPAAETNTLLPAMEEEIESSAIDDTSSASHDSKNEVQIENDEPKKEAVETNELVPAMEEEIKSSAIDDASSDSHDSNNKAQIENDVPKNEAVETNDSMPGMVEETERSIIDDASSVSHISKNEAWIETDEQPATKTNELVPAMEGESERSIIEDASSESHISKNEAQIETDEQPALEKNESASSMEEETAGFRVASADIDTSPDSDLSDNEDLIERFRRAKAMYTSHGRQRSSRNRRWSSRNFT